MLAQPPRITPPKSEADKHPCRASGCFSPRSSPNMKSRSLRERSSSADTDFFQPREPKDDDSRAKVLHSMSLNSKTRRLRRPMAMQLHRHDRQLNSGISMDLQQTGALMPWSRNKQRGRTAGTAAEVCMGESRVSFFTGGTTVSFACLSL